MMLTRRFVAANRRNVFSTYYILQTSCHKHQPSCPASKAAAPRGLCAAKGDDQKGSDGGGFKSIKRGDPGPVRHGFIPEEWFLFFHPKTGVSGPYLFMLTVGNYLVSKEIYVMEHEYYSGLSWLVVIIIVMKKLAPGFAKALDKEVDDYQAKWDAHRLDDINFHESVIKAEKESQFSAQGQKQLIDAKKENVLMQLEAAYRERCMHVYRTVRGRMDYHSKRYYAEARIHQKWMIGWILENVNKSITPEFEKAAFDKCIQDLAAIAGRA